MESELQRGTTTGDGARGLMLRRPTPSRPQLALPPRPPMETLFRNSSDALPSPMLLTPSFLAEHDAEGKPISFSGLIAGTGYSPSSSAFQPSEANFVKGVNLDTQNITSRDSSGERLTGSSENASKEVVGSGRGAGGANAGAIRPSTARFKAMPPSRLPIPRSSYVTIPPGLSPTTLLDSPVLFATHQCEPSPTTGTFPLPPLNSGTNSRASLSSEAFESSSSFVFKPFEKPGSCTTLPALTSLTPLGVSNQQTSAQVQTQVQTQSWPSHTSSLAAVPLPTSTAMAVSSIPLSEAAVSIEGFQSRTSTEVEKNEQLNIIGSLNSEDQKGYLPSEAPAHLERPSNDGYNWRKYGQKQVKGRENPRSYYKCTHSTCPMKKKVEQSLDGQITEIVYRGEHNHPKPQPTHRTLIKVANGSLSGGGRDGNSGGLKSDYTDQFGSANGESSSKLQHQSNYHSNSNPDLSSPSISDDEEGSRLLGGDGNEDEPDGKRRKKEKDTKGTLLVPRTICEPRVVVQTTSDVDILDDGYRWRKYGQKVVKGNPHPRSYYKCTNIGCPVRKHVERSPNDPNAVITTYEGKHNHDVPVARISSHDSAPITGASSSAAQATTSMLDTVVRNGGSLQGDGSEFANVASIVARHLEKAKAERNAVALQFQSGAQISSSNSLSKQTGEDGAFPFVKSEPSSISALRGGDSDTLNARRIFGGMNQFVEPSVRKGSAILPKNEQ
ncbi:hypothetical protein O6H91_01G015400 [Diphasiastrum complanatum]|uniref:Uncharacterized protein n=3 Tax=Diphasiastrum complanatum TaxID=34168 RepID=A0ACC2ENL4_DIPCM|nr:hypothetical protein O6H91_01G015400 [Diphasiastrum complanatum]KAJ7568010.1 hypothetical protein O6H91_01G015400 [Diphasiastrum complanatum]